MNNSKRTISKHQLQITGIMLVILWGGTLANLAYSIDPLMRMVVLPNGQITSVGITPNGGSGPSMLPSGSYPAPTIGPAIVKPNPVIPLPVPGTGTVSNPVIPLPVPSTGTVSNPVITSTPKLKVGLPIIVAITLALTLIDQAEMRQRKFEEACGLLYDAIDIKNRMSTSWEKFKNSYETNYCKLDFLQTFDDVGPIGVDYFGNASECVLTPEKKESAEVELIETFNKFFALTEAQHQFALVESVCCGGIPSYPLCP